VADAPGEIRIALTLLAGSQRPCNLRLTERRRATAADRTRASAEAELARGHGLRRASEPEACRAGIAPYERAQRAFADLGLPRRRAEALYGLEQLQRNCLHDDAAALQAFTRAEPLFAGDPVFESLARQHLGELRFNLGDFDGAIRDDRRALELSRRLGDRTGEALTSSNLGQALHLRGRYDEAAAFLDRALALWQAGDDPGKQAQTQVNRGELYRDLADADRAGERFRAALALYRRAKDRDGEAIALHALGLLAQDAGQPAASLELLQGALRLRPPGSHGRAATLATLGVSYRQLGRLDEARQAYMEALALFRQLGDTREQARTLRNLGRLEDTAGRSAAALDDLDRALVLARTLPDLPETARVLQGKAWVLSHRGDLARARQLLEEALAAVEQHRVRQASTTTRAEFFSTQQDIYGSLIDLLMEMHRKAPGAGYAAAALDVNERSLARSLLDELDRVRDRVHGGEPADDALAQPQPWSAADVQSRLLDRDTLLLEYRLGEKRSFLWAVTPDFLKVFELPGRAEIERAAGPACDLLARSQSRTAEISARQQLARLSRLLLAPVAPLLPGKRLLVVGDGILQGLPFAALLEPAPENPADGEPLVARHEVVSLPSVSVLGELRREAAGRPRAPKTLWVLADPDFGGRFARLPYSGEEAAAILRLAPASERFMVQGRDASRAAVLESGLRDYRFLHFATHGSFGAAEPDGGRLVLAQVDPRGRPEANGFLSLADIYGLRVQADLVVLSACRSALGRELRGEGIMGMTRGFFHAGAERVLVSLWNVNDRVTVELMQRFYRGMLMEGLSPAAALREAQNTIRLQDRWRSPYYWAGFTLQGEWR
jgi:CHAT domain-containing protein/tetratricopeptide (TPR) repeat protein